ncbi:hypothetical protein [Streptomyces erythrochromogenes]|uniref:hypothetical protein n=1 Tax=Streptomyces erythrochromogenes TaxID=285574 RepID=UPI003685B21A
MRRTAILTSTVAVLATLALGTGPAGAASDGTPGAAGTRAGGVAAATPGCTTFRFWRGEGRTEGEICDGHATGWVRDDKADGRCPFTRFYSLWDDQTVDGPQIGPKGAVRYFTVYPPRGQVFARYASIEWRSC